LGVEAATRTSSVNNKNRALPQAKGALQAAQTSFNWEVIPGLVVLGTIAAVATGVTLLDKFNVFGGNPEGKWWWERLWAPSPTTRLPPATYTPPPEYVPPPTPTVRAKGEKRYLVTGKETVEVIGAGEIFPLSGAAKEEPSYEYPETYPAIRP